MALQRHRHIQAVLARGLVGQGVEASLAAVAVAVAVAVGKTAALFTYDCIEATVLTKYSTLYNIEL